MHLQANVMLLLKLQLNSTANVATIFSFAIKPVIAAAASCHPTNPRGIKIGEITDPIEASILEL